MQRWQRIVAALRAMGKSSDEIKALIREKVHRRLFKRDWRTLLGLLHLPFGRFDKTVGLFKPDGVRWLYDSTFGGLRLEDLKTRCVLQTTDFHTGEGVRLERGDLARAVYASSAIYPFFPPVEIDGRLLFDGIYTGPLPLVHAFANSMDIIIAMDFTTDLSPDPRSLLEAMVHINRLFTQTVMRSQTAVTVMLHHYEIVYIKVRFDKVINFWETDGIETLFESRAGRVGGGPQAHPARHSQLGARQPRC
jgi:Predicted esterase of the alpha-beta hydrolase superfamily